MDEVHVAHPVKPAERPGDLGEIDARKDPPVA
jgi:hypothetical protein